MCGVTQEWMSYVFKIFFLFWLVVMCLLSSLDKIDLPLELLAYDVWESKEYKTGVLSVSVKSFDQSCL